MATPAADRLTSRPRRFWTLVDTAPQAGGFAVRLDGRAPRSPAGAPLVVPTAALAEALAAEWRAQGDEVDADAMPLTRLAFTAIDRGPAVRDGLVDELARFAATDTLSYFDDGAVALREEECRRWGPLLSWAADRLGVRLERAVGVMHRPQPEASLDRVRELARAEDDFVLAGLVYAAALFGSAVLALALRRDRVTAQEAHDLARLEEAWQERQWGVDAEAAERTARRLAEARTAGAWFAALA
ncbi:MAG: ATPase [Caulobacteraceae bacterium]|nr:ATPase [Caulobacter sp.]